MKDLGGYKTIKGQYRAGVLDGVAFVKSKDPENTYKYEGFMKKGVFEGIGLETSSSSTYFGYFQAGKKHGIGLTKSSNHCSYLGHWNRGQKDGFGMEHFENCDMYIGEFQQD